MRSYANQIQALFQLFEKYGEDAYFGEEVSQLQHALQSADLAREQFPEDEEFILAAFFHDIGHFCNLDQDKDQLMGNYGSQNHEQIGAIFLENAGLPPKIVQLVAGHVSAKRYLVSTELHYFEGLSEASKQTLHYQGGKMSAQELAAFQQDPLFHLHIALRKIDERAKEQNKAPGSTNWLESMLERIIKR